MCKYFFGFAVKFRSKGLSYLIACFGHNFGSDEELSVIFQTPGDLPLKNIDIFAKNGSIFLSAPTPSFARRKDTAPASDTHISTGLMQNIAGTIAKM